MILAPHRSRGGGSGHARAELYGGEAEPLTFDEFVNLVSTPPPMVLDLLLRYRTLIESGLPPYDALFRKPGVATKLKAAGLRVPERFLPNPGPSDDEVLQVAAELYRKLLTERMG